MVKGETLRYVGAAAIDGALSSCEGQSVQKKINNSLASPIIMTINFASLKNCRDIIKDEKRIRYK